MNKLALFAAASLATASLADRQEIPEESIDRETLYQVALLQSLTAGEYDGVIPISELKKHGDIGLGTFDGVNGEMIVLGGEVYQALGDGTVVVAAEDETTPFATVTYMDEDIVVEELTCKNIDDLKAQLDEMVEREGINQFYLLRIDGASAHMDVRSELKQEKPYKPLDQALATDQREFSYDDVEDHRGRLLPALHEDPQQPGLALPLHQR